MSTFIYINCINNCSISFFSSTVKYVCAIILLYVLFWDVAKCNYSTKCNCIVSALYIGKLFNEDFTCFATRHFLCSFIIYYSNESKYLFKKTLNYYLILSNIRKLTHTCKLLHYITIEKCFSWRHTWNLVLQDIFITYFL